MFKAVGLRSGLRIHAFVIIASMTVLIALLGIRAYVVAKSHFTEINELLEQDVQGQSMLVKMESLMAQRDQAYRKSELTHDPAYEGLAAHHEVAIDRIRDGLTSLYRNTYADLLGPIGKVDSPVQIASVRKRLEDHRRARLIAADQAALGILRLILFAAALSAGIGIWLFQLFFRGLLAPMRELRAATLRIREGDLASRIAKFHGVAELEELGDSFNAMAERLEEAENAKAEFLATVSHEFKNPLAALKEALALLSSRGERLRPESRERAFAACLIASKRLESMLNNLMQHARMERGFFDFDFATKDLATAIETAIKEVTPAAERKNMLIAYEGPLTLPAAFNWDGMSHVFENVLLNAVKYGADRSTIMVKAAGSAPQSSRVEVSVSSFGRTLSLPDLSRIFERFYRGENSSKQQGLGLGLHVVKRIVEAHHGQVAVTSNNERTEFRFWIPGRYENVPTI